MPSSSRTARAHADRIRAWLASLPDLDREFARLDVNSDGQVSQRELLGTGLPAATVDSLMSRADADHSGRVSLAEFKQLGLVLREVAQLRAVVGPGAHFTAAPAVPPSPLDLLCELPLADVFAPVPSSSTWTPPVRWTMADICSNDNQRGGGLDFGRPVSKGLVRSVGRCFVTVHGVL
jgi:hypothetical protein